MGKSVKRKPAKWRKVYEKGKLSSTQLWRGVAEETHMGFSEKALQLKNLA